MRHFIFIVFLIFLAGCSRTPQLNDLYTDTYSVEEVEPVKHQEKESDNIIADRGDIVEEVKEEKLTLNKFIKELQTIRVYFDFDKYEIKESEWPKVEKLASLIKSFKGNFIVRIEGNCDEWGTEEYNYALGLKRAKVVKDALIKLGVDENKLTVISYGELNPICLAHTPECWAKNRRDDFTYLP